MHVLTFCVLALEVCFENAAYIIDEDNGTLEIRVCTNRSDFTANISLNIEAVSVSAQGTCSIIYTL